MSKYEYFCKGDPLKIFIIKMKIVKSIQDKIRMNNIEIALKGIKIASNLLNIPEPSIFFASSDELPNKEVTALFRHKDYEVIFNENWLIVVPWIEVMITCFHETKHAYQSYSINNNINESKETLTKWESDFNTYNMPSGTLDEKADINYLTQSIEIDAIRFTHEKIKELFDVKTIIPAGIKHLVFDE